MGALERFDRALLGVEKAAVAAILAVMGIVVFLDVAYRVSPDPREEPTRYVAVAAAATVLSALALRYKGRRNAMPLGAGIGVGITVLLVLYRMTPNGLMLSEPVMLQPQPLALALTLWLGMFGASIAAHDRRHLALDIGSKLWPPSIAPRVAALGHVVTAAFCLLVLGLAVESTAHNFENWSATEHRGGVLSGTDIPKWTATASILYGMAVLAFRFLAQAARVWTGAERIDEDDTLRQLGIEERG